MLGNFKGHGCDLEATRLWHFMRLSHLTQAVCLVYTWLLQVGRAVIRHGQRHLADRHDRGGLSLPHTGRDPIDEWLN